MLVDLDSLLFTFPDDCCEIALALDYLCGKYAFVIADAASGDCLACLDAVRVVHVSFLSSRRKKSTIIFNYFHGCPGIKDWRGCAG